MPAHLVHAALESQAGLLRDLGYSNTPGEDRYSPELYVLLRLLEFPYERYPAHCYPGHLVLWENTRWGHVEQAIRFIEGLKQPTGSHKGQSIRLLGFQVLILHCILGPESLEDGLRVSRTVVMTIARKNAKTALVAALFLALVTLAAFDLRLEEIRIGASDREQAGKLFEMLRNMILLDDTYGLIDLYKIIPSRKVITHVHTLTTIRVISSEAHRAHGANDFGVLLDEIGNLPDSVARDFYSVLSTGFGTQKEPLLLMFSTQAAADAHLFSEFVDQAAQVNRDRNPDSRLTGFLFDLPKEDDGTGLVLQSDGKTVDVFAEKNWPRANPALEKLTPGGFRSLKDLQDKAREARDMPSLQNSFCNLLQNQRTTVHSPFLSQQAWSACLTGPLDESLLETGECYAGGDLSVTTDLSALVFVWRLPEGQYYARTCAYTPEANLPARSRKAKVPYDAWVKQGHLRAIPGATIDYRVIASDLKAIGERYALERVGFDRYKWREFQRECVAVDFDPYEAEEGDFWVPIGQGFIGMSPCLEALEKLVFSGRLMVEQNPVATACMANAVTVADDAGNRKLSKAKSYGHIDVIVALAMATYLASQGDLDERAGNGRSRYEEGEDLLVL